MLIFRAYCIIVLYFYYSLSFFLLLLPKVLINSWNITNIFVSRYTHTHTHTYICVARTVEHNLNEVRRNSSVKALVTTFGYKLKLKLEIS